MSSMPQTNAYYPMNKMKSESIQLKPSPSKFKTNAQPFYPTGVSNLKGSIGDSLFSNDNNSTSSITGEYLH